MEDSKRKALWPAEVERLLRACQSTREKLVILTLVETAAAPCEVGGLRAGDVDWAESTVTFGSVSVRVSAQLLGVLKLNFEKCETLGIGTRQVQRIVRAVARRAGMDSSVSPDALRRTSVRNAGEHPRLLGQAAEAAPDLILVADDDRRYVDLNHAAAEVFGLSREEILGRRIEEYFSEAGGGPVPAAWLAFAADGEQAGVCVLRSTGARFFYRARSNFLPGFHVSVLRPYSPCTNDS